MTIHSSQHRFAARLNYDVRLVAMRLKKGIKLLANVEGSGALVERGSRVRVRSRGWLSKGEPIRQEPVSEFVVGGRVLIPGIEYSAEGMRVGGTRTVRISPHLAYKEAGVPGIIPKNAVRLPGLKVPKDKGEDDK